MFDELTALFSFLLIVGLLFGGGSWLYSWMTGWSQLTKLYAMKASVQMVSEGSFRWVACDSRWTSLSVSLEIYPQGLWLKPGFPLNFFMSALLIPWEKIEVTEVGGD
ncbi:hypothetical protein [Collimonas arenae]|uniref:hypothetical protein n=1 Tax=Collimonas arenae TaxID=279058 RepID=UPI000778856E|nr:hypothetical protein [Collimonas arenae]